jgi:predicted ester cyclase
MIDGLLQRRDLLRVLGGAVGVQTRIQGASVEKRNIVEKALANVSDPLRRHQYFELYAPEIVLHGYAGVGPCIDSVKRYYSAFWDAFPDARLAADDIIESHDKVVVRFSLTGTHRGRILGIDGTGKAIQLTGMTILRFKGQRCVERWSVTDSLALAAQLGAFLPAK